MELEVRPEVLKVVVVRQLVGDLDTQSHGCFVGPTSVIYLKMKFQCQLIETTYLDRKATSISTTFFNLRYVVSILSSNKNTPTIDMKKLFRLILYTKYILTGPKSAKQKDSPGHVSDGVAASSQEHERQVVLLHELDALGVTCPT